MKTRDISIAVDAATDALARRIDDAQFAADARFDRITASARERLAKATGAGLAQLMVEQLPADVYIRHLDALVQAARDLAHAPYGRQEPCWVRVASVWDVIEDDVVASLVDKETRK